MADKKTPNIGLTLTTDEKTLFKDWREIINGEGTEQNPSNSQIIDTEIGKIKADLSNYYKKSETYSKSEVDELLKELSSIDFKIVNSLEEITEKGHIYLLAKSSPEEGDFYDEYIFVNNKPEKIGSTKINLSDYYTKEETNAELDKKQNKLTAGRNITIDEDNIISATGGGEGSSDYTLDVQPVTAYIGETLPSSISTNPTLYVNGNLSKEEIIKILDKLFSHIPDNFNQYNVTRTQEIDIKGCFFIFRNASKWPITGEKVEVEATGEPLQYLIWMYDGTYQRVWTPERCKITGENVISYVNGNTWCTFDPTHEWEGSKNILYTVLSGSVTGNGYFRNEDSEELPDNRNSLLTSLFSFGFTFKIIANEPHLLLKNYDEIKSDVNLQKHLVTQEEKSVNIQEINESLGFELYSNEIDEYSNQIFCIISWNRYSLQDIRSKNNDKLIDIINKLKDFCSTKKIIGYWQENNSKFCDAVSIQIKNINYTKDQIEIILSNPLGVEECKYLHTIEYISSDKNIVKSIQSSKEFGNIKLAFNSSIFIEGKNYLDIKIDTTVVTREIKDFLKYLVGNTFTINGGYQSRSGIVLVDKEGKYDETSTIPCKITTNSTTKTISKVDIIKSVNKLFKGDYIWIADEDCKAPAKIYLNSNTAWNAYWDASQVQQSFGRCILNTINYAIFLSDNFEGVEEPGTLFLIILNKLDQTTKGYLYLPSSRDLFPRGWYELDEDPIKELENPEVELPTSDENDILWAETLVSTYSILPSGLENYNSFTDSLNNIIQLTKPWKYDNALFFNGLDNLIEFKKIKNNSIFSDELSNNIPIPDSIKYLNIKSDPIETSIKNPLVDGMNVETLYINTNANITDLCNNIPWIDVDEFQKMYPIFSNEDGTVQGMLVYISQGGIVEVFGLMMQINEIFIQVLYVLSGGEALGGIPDHTWLKSNDETGDMELVNYEEPINGNTPIGIIMMTPEMGEDIINMLSHLFSGNEPFEGENVEGLGLIDTNENITKPSDLLPIKTINGNSIIGSGNIVIGGEVDPEQIKELVEAAIAPYKERIEELESTIAQLLDAHSMEENE